MNTNPAHWTREELESLAPDTLDQKIARRAAGTLTTWRLLVGRCLIAMENRDTESHYGCNSAIHYAKLVLRIPPEEARKIRLVASRLEHLSVLTKARSKVRSAGPPYAASPE